MITTLCALFLGLQPSFAAIAPSKITADPSLIDILKRPADVRVQLLEERPNAVYKELVDIALHSDQPMNIRWRALTSAALLRKEESVDDLIKATESSEWFLRNAALVSLSEFSQEKGYQAARRLARDPALVVRSAAVEVLARSENPFDRDLLWSELHESYNKKNGQSLWIRAQIAKLLTKQSQKSEISNFARLLNENEEELQKVAISALEDLTGQKPALGVAVHKRVVEIWKSKVKTF